MSPSAPVLPEPLAAFQEALLAWYATSGRDLPWRHPPYTRDPYALLVTEVMLQQTQVERVIPKWLAWLERFPDLAALAAAPTAEVIRAWEGLGYNLRALRLQQAARAVVQGHEGRLPDDPEVLRRLPGLGPYTAGAVACFGYGRDVAFVDTNIRRVLGRVLFGEDRPPEDSLLAAAETVLPRGHASAWHQALMDVGATLCRVRAPRCLLCPARPFCRAMPALQSAPATRQRLADGDADTPSRRAVAEERARYTTPRYQGSRRYYRGRIVAVLRALADGHGIHLSELGPQVRPGFTSDDLPWLAELVHGLAKDGLVALTGPEDDLGALRASLPR